MRLVSLTHCRWWPDVSRQNENCLAGAGAGVSVLTDSRPFHFPSSNIQLLDMDNCIILTDPPSLLPSARNDADSSPYRHRQPSSWSPQLAPPQVYSAGCEPHSQLGLVRRTLLSSRHAPLGIFIRCSACADIHAAVMLNFVQ